MSARDDWQYVARVLCLSVEECVEAAAYVRGNPEEWAQTLAYLRADMERIAGAAERSGEEVTAQLRALPREIAP